MSEAPEQSREITSVWKEIPAEYWISVFSHVNVQDLKNCRAACSKFNSFIINTSDIMKRVKIRLTPDSFNYKFCSEFCESVRIYSIEFVKCETVPEFMLSALEKHKDRIKCLSFTKCSFSFNTIESIFNALEGKFETLQLTDSKIVEEKNAPERPAPDRDNLKNLKHVDSCRSSSKFFNYFPYTLVDLAVNVDYMINSEDHNAAYLITKYLMKSENLSRLKLYYQFYAFFFTGMIQYELLPFHLEALSIECIAEAEVNVASLQSGITELIRYQKESLKSLEIQNFDITDWNETLGEAENLEKLFIRTSTIVYKDGWVFPSLKFISIYCNLYGKKMAIHLKNFFRACTNLQELRFEMEISNALIEGLDSAPLTKLSLIRAELPLVLDHLQPNIKTLEIDQLIIPKSPKKFTVPNETLEQLNLGIQVNVNNDLLKLIARKLPNLKRLIIRNGANIVDEQDSDLVFCKGLQYLKIGNLKMDSEDDTLPLTLSKIPGLTCMLSQRRSNNKRKFSFCFG